MGGELLDLAEARALDSGHDFVRLYTHELMTENRRYYRRRGYVEYQPDGDHESFLVYMRKRVTKAPD